MKEDTNFDPVAKRKGHPKDIPHLTKQDCATMGDDQFRHTFIRIVNDLIGDMGLHTLANELPFVMRAHGEIDTSEMRELVLANPEWFDAKSP